MRDWRLITIAGCLGALALACFLSAAVGLFIISRADVDVRGLLSMQQGASGRLVVQGDDGNIYTVRPDGADRVALTEDASDTHFYRQPTWSPRGTRVAWVGIRRAGRNVRSTLFTSRSDGTGVTQVETRFPPFYLYWSPDGSRLAYLSNWDTGLALSLLDVAGGGDDVMMLRQGQPFYFSWAPDSQQMLTHVGTGSLGILSIDGEERELGVEPAAFPAPQWDAGGDRLVYAVRTGERQHLIIADETGTRRQTVTRYDGTISFGLSPDGAKLAYVETRHPIGTAAFGPLFVTDLATGETRELSRVPVLAFFWSPDSRHLLFLRPAPDQETTPEPEAIANQRQEELWLRWDVWNGERTYPLTRFVPTPTFLRDYLRFFDQYAQSMTLWAPDGSAIVYAGRNANGRTGIWTHPIAEGSEPAFVMEGVYAAWSPR